MTVQLPPFGARLRHWRKVRGISQLELASRAKTTSRYVSFIETGRSRPGEELVRRLADTLDLPPRETNQLLSDAGHPVAFAERAWDGPGMASVRQIVEQVLEHHNPYPAWAVTGAWQFVAANRAAERFMPGMVDLPPEQAIDRWFGPGPGRSLVENWRECAFSTLGLLHRDWLRSQDPTILGLIARLEQHLEGVRRPLELPSDPVVCPRIRMGDTVVRTVTSVMRFEHAAAVAAAELRVELVFPGDPDSASFFHALAQT